MVVDLEHSETENNKEKYERVLLSGTVKEKAMMIGNHLANINYGEDGFLTADEVNALAKSITSEKETATYKQYQTMFREVDTFLSSIAQCRLTYLEALHRLDKFLVIIECYESLERNTNTILDFISDPKAKASAIEAVASGAFSKKQPKPPYLHYLVSIPDRENHIKIKSISQEELIDIQTQVKNEQVRLKTTIQAVKDFMKEKRFNVRAFSKYLRGIESWAKKDKEELIVLKVTRDEQESSITEPNYEITKIDEKKYKIYREEYLHG
jgi:hypothetical protein